MEWEANWFAASLLMPEEEFKIKFIDFNNCIEKVANYFKVSVVVAEVRAKVLGLGIAQQ